MIFCNLSKSFKRLLDFGFLFLGIGMPDVPDAHQWQPSKPKPCGHPWHPPPWQPLTCFKIFWTSVRSQVVSIKGRNGKRNPKTLIGPFGPLIVVLDVS